MDISYIEGAIHEKRVEGSSASDVDRIENRDEVCGCAIDKECHRICVCPRQRYRVAALLECERAEVQFVSVAWIL